MSNKNHNVPREQWSSSWGFLMAAIGSAIGLGNIWKFSYVTGVNGGGTFVLAYLVCTIVIGVPLLICEISMGRASQRNPLGAFLKLGNNRSIIANLIGGGSIITGILLIAFSAYGHGVLLILIGASIIKYGWAIPGIFSGIIGIILILAVYSVVGGWTLVYTYKAFAGNLTACTEEGASVIFNNVVTGGDTNNLWPAIVGQMTFLVLSAFIVQRGIRKGIEKYAKILMPLLFALLFILMLRGLTLPGAMDGVRFFLAFNPDSFTTRSFIEAIGLSFFSLSLGMGITTTFGSYMSTKQSIVKNAFAIAGIDTLAAIMSGLAIFPAVFAMGFKPDSGTGLVFNILPATFNMIPGGLGWLWSGLFFLIISIAAITSAVSLMETACAVFIDEAKMRRTNAVLCTLIPTALIGTICTFSVLNWDKIPTLKAGFKSVFNSTSYSFFGLLDGFTTNWFLPISGVLIAVFVGWVWGIRNALKEIRKSSGNEIDTNILILLSGLHGEDGYGNNPHKIFTASMIWGIMVRFIAPIGILFAFLYSIGVI